MRLAIGGVARLGGPASLLALLLAYACSDSQREFGSGGGGGEAGDAAGSSSGGSAAGNEPTGGTSSAGSATDAGAGAGGEAGQPGPGPCSGAVCLNGGQCSVSGDTFSCDCAGTGYTGATCAENVNECDGAPCQNGGECDDTEGSYTCTCVASGEYTGKNCDLLRFEPLPAGFVASDVSPEGGVVVGSNDSRASKYVGDNELFLGTYIGDANSVALGASSNGTIVVGASGTGFPLTDTSRAVLWKGSAIEELDMPEGYTLCEASDVSADGSVIVGTCDYKVVRWVDGELEELGIAEGVESCREAVVSDDGNTIGGLCSIYPSTRAFLWTEETGYQLLVSLPVAAGCLVLDLSADGSAATGYCASGGSFTAAYYWTADGGPQELLRAPSTSLSSGGALTADGARVVGNNGAAAAVWDDLEGASTPLADLLPAALPSLDGWSLYDATSISSDGKTIVGRGALESEQTYFIARPD